MPRLIFGETSKTLGTLLESAMEGVMMDLTTEELGILLEGLKEVYGPGVSKLPTIAKLQGKLSIWLEAKLAMERDQSIDVASLDDLNGR